MSQTRYKSHTLSYDHGEIYIDGAVDKSGKWSPSFVDNGPDVEPTFIGFTNKDTKEFVSLTGKILRTVTPEEIDI